MTKSSVPALAESKELEVIDYAAMAEYAGQGLDDLDASDLSIPFLKVLEKNSPEIDTVDGARPGMFINTATQKLYPNGVRFVPATRDHMFVEWVPVDAGGGLVASYGILEPISKWAMAQRGKIKLKNGNDLVETFYLYGVLLPEVGEDGEPTPAVISFTSTRIKAYKSISNRASGIMLSGPGGRKFKAPWFAHIWRITAEKKVDGSQSWYVYKAEFDGPSAEAVRIGPSNPVFQMAAEMARQKSAGELKVNMEGAAGDQPDTGTSGGSTGAQAGEMDEPPF